jgi:hypothetical protein
MSSEYDPSEFVDDDFPAGRKAPSRPAATPFAAGAAPASLRAPNREEVESRVLDMQQKLAELKREQQDLERERSTLEELRRRQNEFTTGRTEMVQSLTRGIALLQDAEFNLRRDAEQMAKSLVGLREALEKIQSIHDETWTAGNLEVELTRALTAVENARMEWNSSRLKFPVLSGETAAAPPAPTPGSPTFSDIVQQRSYAELCKLGLALTWPLLIAGLAIFIALLMKK